MTHTPGPWSVWGDDECPSTIPVIEIGAGEIGHSGCKQLCYVQPSLTEDDEEFILSDEDRANARLIAAAPDLLEALEVAIAHPARFDGSEQAMIRAAIEKATKP